MSTHFDSFSNCKRSRNRPVKISLRSVACKSVYTVKTKVLKKCAWILVLQCFVPYSLALLDMRSHYVVSVVCDLKS